MRWLFFFLMEEINEDLFHCAFDKTAQSQDAKRTQEISFSVEKKVNFSTMMRVCCHHYFGAIILFTRTLLTLNLRRKGKVFFVAHYTIHSHTTHHVSRIQFYNPWSHAIIYKTTTTTYTLTIACITKIESQRWENEKEKLMFSSRNWHRDS